MPKVMAMGRHAAILPFRAVGVEPMDVKTIDEAKAVLRQVRDSDEETLLLIPEELALGCGNEIAQLRQSVSVVVMTLPATTGKPGLQREHVRQMVARSLGVDLMGKK